jgi:hypothetical protein
MLDVFAFSAIKASARASGACGTEDRGALQPLAAAE